MTTPFKMKGMSFGNSPALKDKVDRAGNIIKNPDALKESIELQKSYKNLTTDEKEKYNTLSTDEKMKIKNSNQLKESLSSGN